MMLNILTINNKSILYTYFTTLLNASIKPSRFTTTNLKEYN